jgi:hypothetical protein
LHVVLMDEASTWTTIFSWLLFWEDKEQQVGEINRTKHRCLGFVLRCLGFGAHCLWVFVVRSPESAVSVQQHHAAMQTPTQLPQHPAQKPCQGARPPRSAGATAGLRCSNIAARSASELLREADADAISSIEDGGGPILRILYKIMRAKKKASVE